MFAWEAWDSRYPQTVSRAASPVRADVHYPVKGVKSKCNACLGSAPDALLRALPATVIVYDAGIILWRHTVVIGSPLPLFITQNNS
jgi:hypothetical protein